MKAFEPPDGYYHAFSGGKDSLCIYYLALKTNVKVQAYYNHTTVDPPELIYFIRENFPEVIFTYPQLSMWQLIVNKKIPPTRIVRYCCSYLKESQGIGKTVVTGVRWAESNRRKTTRGIVENWGRRSADKIMLLNDNDINRRFMESCIKNSRFIVNPIIDWTDDEVWEFIKKYNYKYCCLYDRGNKRLGCIGCPLSGSKNMKMDFGNYPKYFNAYLRAFDRMVQARSDRGLSHIWKDGQHVMDWWLGDYKFPKEDERLQVSIDEYMELENL